MYNMEISNLIVLLLIILMLFVITWFIISIIVLFKLYKKYKNNTIEILKLNESNKDRVIEYSNKLLDFTKMMVSQISILKFKTFIDNSKIDKITKSQVEKIVTDVASSVKDALNMNNITIEDTIYTEEFFNQYIIDTSIYTVKQLMNKVLSEYDEKEEDQEDY